MKMEFQEVSVEKLGKLIYRLVKNPTTKDDINNIGNAFGHNLSFIGATRCVDRCKVFANELLIQAQELDPKILSAIEYILKLGSDMDESEGKYTDEFIVSRKEIFMRSLDEALHILKAFGMIDIYYTELAMQDLERKSLAEEVFDYDDVSVNNVLTAVSSLNASMPGTILFKTRSYVVCKHLRNELTSNDKQSIIKAMSNLMKIAKQMVLSNKAREVDIWGYKN
jgi:hypothetical protein